MMKEGREEAGNSGLDTQSLDPLGNIMQSQLDIINSSMKHET